MIEWALLASGLVSAVTPLLAKGAEKIADKAAEEGWTQRGAIWEKIKGLFAGDEEMLHIYQRYPETEKIQEDFSRELKAKLEAAPEIAKELDEMLKTLPQAQQVKTNTIEQSGDDNIAVQDTTGSTININR